MRQQQKIDLTQLRVGLPLRYDLVTPEGEMLVKAGTLVTSELKASWARQGIRLALTYNAVSETDSSNSSSGPKVEPYDETIIQRLHESIQRASDVVLTTASQLLQGGNPKCKNAQEVVEEVHEAIAADAAAVLAAFAQSLLEAATENDLLLAQRSSQMLILGLILAVRIDLSAEDQNNLAMAALYHDISLLDAVRSRGIVESVEKHPINSAALLESVAGLNKKIAIAVSQVHEQVDGTGFPRRLPSSRIIMIARILNVVDAYLTLTSNMQPSLFPDGRCFHPADALGYLMYHAARGRFDRTVVRALVDVGSLYPIGCRVLLSNNALATVFRSNQGSPSLPIVRIESQDALIDLSQSGLKVDRPASSAWDICKRIRKSSLPEVFWRTC